MDHEQEASSSRSHSRVVSFGEEVIEEEIAQVEVDEMIEEESESLPSSIAHSSPLSQNGKVEGIYTPPSSVSDDGSSELPASKNNSAFKLSSNKPQGSIWARIKTATSNSKRVNKALSTFPNTGLQPGHLTKPSS